MLSIRSIREEDKPLLEKVLTNDEYHAETKPEFFFSEGSMCNVYELDGKPVMFVRGTKALRLDIQFVSNEDFRSNREALIKGFKPFAENVKNAGFTELIFNSKSPLLVAFCKKHFGFIESEGELRKFL